MSSLLILNPDSISENEVQSILAELGYENVLPDHLHQFITDLKRMIRHDQKHGSFPSNMPSLAGNLGSFGLVHSRTQEKASNTNERKLPSTAPSPVSVEDKRFLETEETKKKLKPNRFILNLDGCDISVEESLSLVKSHSCASVSEQIRTGAQTTSGSSSSSKEKDTDLLGKPNFKMSTEVKGKTTQSRLKDLRLLKDPVRLYHWYNTHWQRHPPPSNPKQA